MMSSTTTLYVLTISYRDVIDINGGVTPNLIAMLKEVCDAE